MKQKDAMRKTDDPRSERMLRRLGSLRCTRCPPHRGENCLCKDERTPCDAEDVARRAKLAELGERVLEILQTEQRLIVEDARKWRPTAALVSAEIHTAARLLGLLAPEAERG